MNCH